MPTNDRRRYTEDEFRAAVALCPNCHALTPTYRGRNIGRSNGNSTTEGE